MRTILVPLEKSKARSPRSDGRSKEKSDTATINMEASESRKEQKKAISTESLKSCLKGKSFHSVKKDSSSHGKTVSIYGENDIPPPYVIWVQYMGMGGTQEPPEQPLNYDPATRNSFVVKVFTLVFIMFLIAAGICTAMNLIDSLRDMLESVSKFLILIPPAIVLIILNYAIMCTACARKAPCSYICLVLAAICVGILCGGITMWRKTFLIYCALGATVIIIIVCFGLAFSSFDFTKYMLYIVLIATAVGAVLLVFVVAKFIFKIDMKPLHIGILLVAVVVEVILLAMQLQMVLGGKTVELGVDEYAAGAFMVFMSIFSIFAKVLQLSSLFDDN